MIRCENIRKSFGDHEVLKGISFTFEKGKTNLIIGKSGSGKTVLLKTLVGLFKPSSGKIFYENVDFGSLDKKSLRELRMQVGMLFQGNALFDSMTIEQNVRFPMDMFTTMTLKEKTDRVNYCLERVSLVGVNRLAFQHHIVYAFPHTLTQVTCIADSANAHHVATLLFVWVRIEQVVTDIFHDVLDRCAGHFSY